MQYSSLLFVCMCACALASGYAQFRFREYVLQRHNEYRKSTGSKNDLIWSDRMATFASRWMSSCSFDNQHPSRGVNIAFYSDAEADDQRYVERAFRDWTEERNSFNYGDGESGSYFGQKLGWGQTRQIGCAVRRCPSFYAFGQVLRNQWYVSCFYDPRWEDNSNEGESEVKETEVIVTSENNQGYTRDEKELIALLRSGNESNKDCTDVYPDCGRFRSSCKRNTMWMLANCRDTCGFCE